MVDGIFQSGESANVDFCKVINFSRLRKSDDNGFRKNKFYVYDSILDTVRIQAYIDKIAQPVRKFRTLEEAEKFFTEENLDSQGRIIQSTKVLGIFYDLEDMDEDLNEFTIAAEQMVDNPNINFATVRRNFGLTLFKHFQ